MRRERNSRKRPAPARRRYVLIAAALLAAAALTVILAQPPADVAVSPATLKPRTAGSEVEALAQIAPHTRPGAYNLLVERYLPLRAGPDAQSEVIGRITAGDQVTVLDWVGAYTLVRSNRTGVTGYAVGGFLAPAEADAFLAREGVVDVSQQLYGYDDMRADLAALRERYPDLLALGSIGTTPDGREIPVAVAGNPDASVHFLIHASIHAREYMCTLLVMKQLEAFLSEYETGDPALRDVVFHVIPMANPDGVAISQQGPEAIADPALHEGLVRIYEREREAGNTDLSQRDYFSKWKANARGVDLNCNYDARWEDIGGPSDPSSSGYKGEAPESEPETQALARYTREHRFAGTISYHAYGSGYFWDFGQQGALREKTRRLAWLVQSVSGYLPLEEILGGDSAGGYKDWAIEKMSIPSLTIEIGTTSCPMSIREFPSLWERNREIWTVAAQWAAGTAVIG